MGGAQTLCIRSTVSASNEPLHGRAARIAAPSGASIQQRRQQMLWKGWERGGGGGEAHASRARERLGGFQTRLAQSWIWLHGALMVIGNEVSLEPSLQ